MPACGAPRVYVDRQGGDVCDSVTVTLEMVSQLLCQSFDTTLPQLIALSSHRCPARRLVLRA